MKKSEFRNLIREEVKNMLSEIAKPISLQGKHNSGNVVVALFFDHSKQQNNSQKLWSRVIEFASDPEVNFSLKKYFVTDSVVEFEFKPMQRGRYDMAINALSKNIDEMQGAFTSYDIYTI